MISKEDLIAGLQGIVRDEDGMITLFTNFSRVMVKYAKDLGEDKKEKIETLLARLYRESAGHKEIVYNLIREIRGDARDEF